MASEPRIPRVIADLLRGYCRSSQILTGSFPVRLTPPIATNKKVRPDFSRFSASARWSGISRFSTDFGAWWWAVWDGRLRKHPHLRSIQRNLHRRWLHEQCTRLPCGRDVVERKNDSGWRISRKLDQQQRGRGHCGGQPVTRCPSNRSLSGRIISPARDRSILALAKPPATPL